VLTRCALYSVLTCISICRAVYDPYIFFKCRNQRDLDIIKQEYESKLNELKEEVKQKQLLISRVC